MADYTNKNILIWGFGREGSSSLKYFLDRGCTVSVTDSKSLDIPEYIPWAVAKDRLGDFDFVVKSPGVPLGDVDISNVNITAQTDIFLQNYSASTIGITGTKGKSTTSSLIHHILHGYNGKSHLAGNIGIPPLNILPILSDGDTTVLEMSCHQLELLHSPAPHIAVFLNIFEEHLDRYKNLDGYARAKANILTNQKTGDVAIVGQSALPYVRHLIQQGVRLITAGDRGCDIELTDSGAVCCGESLPVDISETALLGRHNLYNIAIAYTVCVQLMGVPREKFSDGAVCCGESLPVDISETALLGRHNLYNIAIAYTVCVQLMGVPREKFSELVKTFQPLPHRLQYVGCFGGIKYYDDSISTAVDTAINALETLENVDTVIVGGMDRGIDYTRLAEYLIGSGVKNILLIGQTTERIYKLLKDDNTAKNIYRAYTMEAAIKEAVVRTPQGGIVLLSPAAASYDSYENFEKRGEHFCKLIKDRALAK